MSLPESVDPFDPRPDAPPLTPGWLIGAEEPDPVPPTPPVRRKPPTWRKRQLQVRVRRLGARLGHAAQLVLGGPTPAYPLSRCSWLRGLPPAGRALLANRFHASVPRRDWGSPRAARLHLLSLVPVWPLGRWDKLLGLHVVLGAAGSGKTTLVLKLGRRLRSLGRRVAVVSLFPQPWKASEFLAATAEFELEAAVARTKDDWTEVFRSLDHYDVVLVDTPCILSHASTSDSILRLPEVRATGGFLHYAVSLHHRRDLVLQQVQHAQEWGVDFLSLPQVDLAPGPGALLDLQLERMHPISLVNADPHPDGELHGLDPLDVLRALGATPD